MRKYFNALSHRNRCNYLKSSDLETIMLWLKSHNKIIPILRYYFDTLKCRHAHSHILFFISQQRHAFIHSSHSLCTHLYGARVPNITQICHNALGWKNNFHLSIFVHPLARRRYTLIHIVAKNSLNEKEKN